MKQKANHEERPACPGDHLRKLVICGTLGGLFFSLLGTGLAWAGAESFNCSPAIWKGALALNLLTFILTWVAYLPFRNTDLLLGNGVLSMFLLFNAFWMFGFGGFYFYFLFSPINLLVRVIAVLSFTAALIHRAYQTFGDIHDAFSRSKNLLGRMYFDEGASIMFRREAIDLLEKARKSRNPFRSVHVYAAMLIAPFVLVLNRVLTPFFGEGHGFFLILAFFAAPILLWLADLFVQTALTMIRYPLKLQQETGKEVLLKDW